MRGVRFHVRSAILSTLLLAALTAFAVERSGETQGLRDIPGFRWMAELPADPLFLALDGDSLFATDAAGTVHRISLDKGRILFSSPAMPDPSMLVVDGEQVLAAGKSGLQTLDRSTGKLGWTHSWATCNTTLLGIDVTEYGWLVRTEESGGYATLLLRNGIAAWRVGPSVGSVYLAGDLVYTLSPGGDLEARNVERGDLVWRWPLPRATYRLGTDGILSGYVTHRPMLRIQRGPSLKEIGLVRGADPRTVTLGPVVCDAKGCTVDLPTGKRWFEGHVTQLPDELRVIRSVDGERHCIGCLGLEQPELMRVDSWTRDGARRTRSAFIHHLDAVEDDRGFVEMFGQRIIALDWRTET